MKPVHSLLSVAGNVDVIHHGRYRTEPERYIKGNIPLYKPVVLRYPGIFKLALLALPKFLLEKPEMIVEPYSVSGQSQGRYGVKEARRKSAETAVSE